MYCLFLKVLYWLDIVICCMQLQTFVLNYISQSVHVITQVWLCTGQAVGHSSGQRMHLQSCSSNQSTSISCIKKRVHRQTWIQNSSHGGCCTCTWLLTWKKMGGRIQTNITNYHPQQTCTLLVRHPCFMWRLCLCDWIHTYFASCKRV